MAKEMVYKSNALIDSASYRLSVMEQRIILSCISKVRREDEVTDEIMYSVHASEISELSSTNKKDIYPRLKEAAFRLKRREVKLHRDANNNSKRVKTLITNWVQTIVYNDNEGSIELRFSKDILPYISRLNKNFTRYRLQEIGELDSAHAIRLYEILVQYKAAGCREVLVEDLKEMMQLEDRYNKIAELKRRVIDPAVDQINKHTTLTVTYDQMKQGRKIVAFVFSFEQKSLQGKLDLPDFLDFHEEQAKLETKKKVLSSNEEAMALARPGEAYPITLRRLTQEGYQLKFKPNFAT
ncbi:RepB family plasmid replication initiator protein [Oceanospirillum beijerinckii]|uniref:RepB family plasmid replication initiator protein n=1 Tax=Oceanospirillum beijerinckii TaxID=64976 RepID=UPI0003F9B4A7|nr:RepB family plasmid replication initiator protein [Oceanospirillum beijerinckii]